jgi:hypothetical protein
MVPSSSESSTTVKEAAHRLTPASLPPPGPPSTAYEPMSSTPLTRNVQ